MLRPRLSVLGLTIACQLSGVSLAHLQAQQVEEEGHDRPSPESVRVVRFDDASLPPAPQVKVEPFDPRSILARRQRAGGPGAGNSTSKPNETGTPSSEPRQGTSLEGAIGSGGTENATQPSRSPESAAADDSDLIFFGSEETSQDGTPSPDDEPAGTENQDQEEGTESQDAGDVEEETEPVTEEAPELGYDFLGKPVSTESLDGLRRDLRRTLIHYHQKPEAASDYSPWGIMHALIAYGADTEILAGRRKVNAIGWLCWNGTCRGQQLLRAKGNRVSAGVGVGLQGHEGQFLAMLAQSHVPADFELRVGEQRFTVADLIKTEQETCRPKTELTFKLIAFSHYLGSEATWKSNDGQQWDISRLIREEIAQPVLGAACGGTHRLMGLSYAVATRRREGLPIDGEFRRAQIYVHDFQQHAIALRNRDGSFSTKWLERREAREDEQRRVQTTGHILEWLVYSLPEEQLRSPEIVRTVTYLNNLMWEQRSTQWEIGPKGHALHALNMYDQKVFGARIGQGGPRLEWR